MAMNIKQAKQEIEDTLRAYLAKDELGNYRIPSKRQRPVLLMGPPGIGKTQIMEQIAAETGVGLVAYTVTHHTRQSAVGLPFIVHEDYNGEEVSVTRYTMSEILASVYDLMEQTGLEQGILFLDEINCVSETLTPVMLQFLQYKTFGNRKLPEGWLIVAAGNPPEYNRSARAFDVVTLDRVKYIEVEEDFEIWKEYAWRNGLHGAVISYLDIRKENFYRIENTVDGTHFATARGWEDLSEMIQACEQIGVRVDRQVIEQYIQMPDIARDFAGYLDLYYKYQSTYHVEEILRGRWEPVTVRTMQTAPFDEKLSVMGLLFARLSEAAGNTRREDILADRLHQDLIRFRDESEDVGVGDRRMEELAAAHRKQMRLDAEANRLSGEERDLRQREVNTLEKYAEKLRQEKELTGKDAVMELVRQMFQEIPDRRQDLIDDTGIRFDNAFRFLEASVGQRQEMVIFVTQITAGFDTSWFVENFGCDAYYRHNRELLFDDVEQRIRGEIQAAREQSGDRRENL